MIDVVARIDRRAEMIIGIELRELDPVRALED
jgi:hypothetical protein